MFHSRVRPLFFLVATMVVGAPLAQDAGGDSGGDAGLAAARRWFATAPGERADQPGGAEALSRREVEALLPELFAACRDGARALGSDTLPQLSPDDLERALQPSTLQIGDYEMPYVLLVKGEKPAAGWPLFLCLHGGGGNDKAPGPHGWSVNSREWQAQKSLWRAIYEPAGIYFIPRMADDRRGRWWHDHNQIAFDEIIRKSILFRDVDPNRVYLMGISEGGYGAIRFAGNRPDRFAATGGMAAAEPIATSPPENMRNVGMRIDIGENDTMFDRIGLARRMGERLQELRRDDPEGYDFEVFVQAGRGHGIDYSLTPKWLAGRVRDPRPCRVVWTVKKFDSRVALQNYWLALEAVPERMPLFLDATVKDNRITLEAMVGAAGADPTAREPLHSGRVLVRLDDRLADLDEPITVVVNGIARPPVRLTRSLAVMARTLAERSDINYCFCAELV
ncbi:MAG: hypothetical protein KDC98_24060, partial [Planctomycetes bacterium]|nr:hypothetical protein [Planctomycetota bacterium]